eukprot:TRINITY_DN2664_c0_g1_i1.p1 TRINITY_DN2664_c0_g1~~TRINITY_DN2664_c0_g1_i1.p1  ORF type:complete len:557 (-),score=99.88 TRINITY_DN2664_c0_g1_i1:23-1570(-)
MAKDDFIKNYWQKSPLLVKHSPQIFSNYALTPTNVADIFSHKIFPKLDYSLLQYVPSQDDMDERTDISTFDQVKEAISSEGGYSLKINRPYAYSKDLRNLYVLFSSMWSSSDIENGVRMELSFSPTDCIPFMPHHDGHETFLFQIKGKQQVFIFNNPDESSVSGASHASPVLISLTQLPEKDLIAEFELEPGNILYIPKQFVRYSITIDKSEELKLSLPPQLDWVKWVDLLMSHYTKTLNNTIQHTPFKYGIQSSTSSTSSTSTSSSSSSNHPPSPKELVKNFLQSSNNLVEPLSRSIEYRKKYTKLHFELGEYVAKKYDIKNLLEENDGLVKLSNFLPDTIAKRIHEVLTEISENEWVDTESEQDYSNNNIAHAFKSAKSFPYSETIFDIFRHLIPDQESTLSAARYSKGHFIDPHDDNATKTLENGVYDRDIAIIYYLTPNWKEEDGGLLVDLEKNQKYVPEFNSLISFVVPRQHEVTKIVSDKSRFSIFGWFLYLPPEVDVMEGDKGVVEEN